ASRFVLDDLPVRPLPAYIPTSYLFSKRRASACHPERRRREGSAFDARSKADPSLRARSARFAQDDGLARSLDERGGKDVLLERGSRHSPNRTRHVSCSWPVGRVSDSYSSGRRARNQRLPDDVGRTDASRSATTMSSPSARDSAMTSP